MKNAPEPVILSASEGSLFCIFKGLREMLRFAQHDRTRFSAPCWRLETWRGQSIDSALVDGRFTEGNGQRSAESKGLDNRSPVGLFWGPGERRNAAKSKWLIPRWLMANLLRKMGKGVMNLKDLLAVLASDHFGGPGERPKCGEGNLLILRWLTEDFTEGNGQRLAESKGLDNRSPVGLFWGPGERRNAAKSKWLIPRWLMANLLRKMGKGVMNLKDLLAVLASDYFGGPGERPKCGEGNLLILHWLSARLARRTDQALLKLKDLLTVFSPNLKNSFENEPVLRSRFCAESRQILAFSAKTCQNRAEN
jgi:hypothetical protein